MDLLPTQIEDAAYLAASPHGGLFSEPGTGKTLTLLAGVKAAGADGFGVVIAPPIALRMWKENIESFLGAKAQILRSSKDLRDPSADFFVTTYSLAAAFEWLRDATYLLLDEADALKTLSSQRTVSIYGKRASGKDCLMERIPFVWPATGTPIRRYPDDLYPWFRALHPQVLKDYDLASLAKFQSAFCVTQMRRFHPRMPAKLTVVGGKNEDNLRRLIYHNGLAVRRVMADVAQFMPPLVERSIAVDFVDSQELREASLGAADLESAEEGILTTARRLLGIAKAKACAEYIVDEQEAQDGPILVLFWHKEVREALVKELLRLSPDLAIRVIDGATPTSKREQYEDEFNAGAIDLLLGQIQSMGVALNLQRGSNRAIFVERDWSPSSQEQGYKRVWRLGQQSKVLVDYCLADHMVDEALTSVNARKLKINKRIMG